MFQRTAGYRRIVVVKSLLGDVLHRCGQSDFFQILIPEKSAAVDEFQSVGENNAPEVGVMKYAVVGYVNAVGRNIARAP